jgi:uncharacterized protein YabN with tetrapyrrole methylase and pyrophosphatase domain
VKNLLCPKSALEAWHSMSPAEQQKIEDRLSKLKKDMPDLLFSIKTLKKCWEVAHAVTSFEQSLEYFRSIDEEVVADALVVCRSVYDDSLVSEYDDI